MQLKFDIYYQYDKEAKKYSIYRLLPKPRKIIFSCNEDSVKIVEKFMYELEIGNTLNELEQLEKIENNVLLKSVYSALCNYHMLISPDVEYKDSPYKRQLEMFEAWDDSGIKSETYQERLAQASILIIGAGGLGSNIVNQVANIGIGKTYVADYDEIENSNLSRQFLYTPQDIGENKSIILADQINKRELGKVIPINKRINPSNVIDVIKENKIELVTGITNSSMPERNELVKVILKENIPVLSISEHYVGPLLSSLDEYNRFIDYQNKNFVLQKKYLEKRELQKITNRHPSMITGLSMVSAICASDILNYFSKVVPCKLENTVYSLEQETLNFRIMRIVGSEK